jgi:rare lipoprotein A
MRPRAINVNPLTPLQFWLLVGASCVALIVILATCWTRPVEADARLPRPAATATPGVVANATPAMPISSPAPVKQHGKLLRGIASWYGTMFDGKKTASGETYDMNEMTACHPNLPFGTEVRVTNLRNKKSVIVRITDRSELVKGRIIDLSYAAAEKLQMTKTGLARVSLEILPPDPSAPQIQ